MNRPEMGILKVLAFIKSYSEKICLLIKKFENKIDGNGKQSHISTWQAKEKMLKRIW